jgi:4'-phosphopantetheinyl transferase
MPLQVGESSPFGGMPESETAVTLETDPESVRLDGIALARFRTLEQGSVHIWFIPHGGGTRYGDALSGCLSREEEVRARAILDPRLQSEFRESHAIRRAIIGCYASIDPAHLRFGVAEFGKPFLTSFPALHFSASRTQGLSVLAVSRVGPLGVDAEWLRPILDADELARRVCSDRERDLLGSVSGADRDERFLRFWTRKESVVKAIGTGLSEDLRTVDVSEESVVRSESHAGHRLKILDLDTTSSHVAACAVSSAVESARQFRLE